MCEYAHDCYHMILSIGEYAQALQQYMESLKTMGNQKHSEEHIKSSTAGIARMTLRTGNEKFICGSSGEMR